MVGIYCIENKVNGKKYIGQTNDFDNRIYHHKWNWNKENYYETSGENKPLWYAVKKYGENNFDIFILEECEIDNLDYLETLYIDKLNSLVSEKGYNILKEGFSRKGIHHSEQTKEKISMSNKGKKRTLETKSKISKAKIGIKRPIESVEKMKANRKGKLLGKDNPSYKNPPFLGKSHTQETKQKQSDARKRYWNAKKNFPQ